MGLITLFAIGFGVWLYLTRKSRSRWQMLAWGLGLGAGLLAAKGMPILAAIAGGAAVLIRMAPEWFPVLGRPSGSRSVGSTPPATKEDTEAAFELLGLTPDADAEAVKAAHRRLISRTHPDSGGSAALARSINAARDAALASIAARPKQQQDDRSAQ